MQQNNLTDVGYNHSCNKTVLVCSLLAYVHRFVQNVNNKVHLLMVPLYFDTCTVVPIT